MWRSKKTKASYALLDLLAPHEVPSLMLERWGPESDGAYILPVELMSKSKVLISGGVADNVRFEEEVAEKVPGIRIGLFDHTISKAPDHTPTNAVWYKLGLGSGEGLVSLERAAELSGAVAGEPVAIKLDIEAAEWDLVDSTPPEFWKRVDLLIIEIHGFEIQEKWEYYRAILEKLNRWLLAVHVHGNNYSETVHFRKQGVRVPFTLEITYINRKWIPPGMTPAKWNHVGPTRLDRPNFPFRPDIRLDYWMQKKNIFLRRLKKNIQHILFPKRG